MTTPRSLLTWLLVLGASTSCTTEDQLYSPTSSAVEMIFTLKSPTAMNGKITIREAYLKLDRVQATGSLGGNNSTDITQTIPAEEPPYQLTRSDSGKINFTLPFRDYDRLDFHLFLFQDNYDLVFQENPVSEVPDPVDDNESGPSDDNDSDDDNNEEGDGDTNNEQDSDDSDNDSNDNEDDDQENQDDGDDDKEGDDKQNDNKNKDGDKDKDDEDKDDDDEEKDDEDEDKDDDGNDRDDDDDGDGDDDDDGDEDDDGRSGRSEKQIVNLEDFFQNAKPAMVLVGSYGNNGRIISIILVITDIAEIIIPAEQNGSFALSLNKKNSGVITFDPEVLFEGISPADIESAQIQQYQQQNVVFIHRHSNTQLYQLLSPRLEQSAALNFSSRSDL